MSYELEQLRDAYLKSQIDPSRAIVIGEAARVFAGLLPDSSSMDVLVDLEQYKLFNNGVGWFDTDAPKPIRVGFEVPIYAMFSTQGLLPENYEQVKKLGTEVDGIIFVHRSILVARDARAGLVLS